MSNTPKTDALIARLEPSVDRDIYVWGGQGQVVPSEQWIRDKETSAANGNRAVAYYRKQLKKFLAALIRAYDCSGLLTDAMMAEGLLPYDTTANGLKNRCRTIEKTQLKKGCLVFRVYTSGSKKGQAYHVGIVADDDLRIIESKGRDDGVVKRTLNASGSGHWNVFGVYNKLEDEYAANEQELSAPQYSRLLKLVKPYISGGDVRAVQRYLHENGYSPGSIDGVYGSNTQKAVKAYQKDKGLKVDGIVGPKTWGAMFNNAAPGAPDEPTIRYTRLLKNTGKPYTRGDDIRAAQLALERKGFDTGGVDGVYGPKTEKAVRAFQQAAKLVVDGIAGPKTWAALEL